MTDHEKQSSHDQTSSKGNSAKESKEQKESSSLFTAPSISLPKGGGALKGIGEKFATNPVTGTGSMTVPIPVSPSRSGFQPQLSLSYDSGAGNGPFGLGWHLSLPTISRKTDKGLPRYIDNEESDVFILSGSEDLVPLFKKDDNGNCILKEGKPAFEADDSITDGYKIRLYKPRIEGLFARIERWTDTTTGDIHWRSYSKDNILTIYGKDKNSRIANPENPKQIFSWLITETRDDKGNVIYYQYKEEDSININLSQINECNRGEKESSLRKTNRYIKNIFYGYQKPLLNNDGTRPISIDLNTLNPTDWMFQVVFDYGEHLLDSPTPHDAGNWLCRSDSFSSYRSGFEVRQYRLCQRILMFHHFQKEKNVGNNCLVRSLDFIYQNNPIACFISSITQSSYRRINNNYLKKSLPSLDFEYSQAIISKEVKTITEDNLQNLPIGIDGTHYQWIDLFGEGVSGIFSEHAGSWYYKRNLSPAQQNKQNQVQFATMECVAQKPNIALNTSRAQLMDLDSDGEVEVVLLDGPTPGFMDIIESNVNSINTHDTATYHTFKNQLNIALHDPNLKWIDLNGDGHADILITEENVLTWYPSLAKEGFSPAIHTVKSLDENKGLALVFADPTQSIFLADMSGDGLTDVVRIRNGEICYWPNLGYGRFGAKTTMDNSPWFDAFDIFDQRRIRLADIDGSGTTDLLYLAKDGVDVYFNQSGNAWSDKKHIDTFPQIDNLSAVSTLDLLGNGTACLVWSSPLPDNTGRQLQYIDLMGGQKPHLLIKSANNLGAETVVTYASSAKFYVQDKLKGQPWITRLPFPVYVVETVETLDRISGNRFKNSYAYHHGYYDGVEREFRGFGMVEQWDTETFEAFQDPTQPPPTNSDDVFYIPPVYTKTWFHTGVYKDRENISNYFAGLIDENDTGEYYRPPSIKTNNDAKKYLLPDTVLPPNLPAAEEREACRALKGSMLRQEVYALDGTSSEKHPYMVTEQNFTIEWLQPQLSNQHSIFFTHAREAITYHYERNPEDPRIAHSVTLKVDSYGNVLQSASIAYGRKKIDATLREFKQYQAEQTKTHIVSTENQFTNVINAHSLWRTPLPSESKTFEVTGIQLASDTTSDTASDSTSDNRFSWDFLYTQFALAQEIAYDDMPTYNKIQKRLIEHSRTLYRKDDLSAPLALHRLESRALPYENYALAFTPTLIKNIFDTKVTEDMLQMGGYVKEDNLWWIPSGKIFFSPLSSDDANKEWLYAKAHFFQPIRYRNPFHKTSLSTETIVRYDPYDLLLEETIDARDNRVTVGLRDKNPTQPLIQSGNDYRVLQPYLMMDPNRNQTMVAFDTFGFVVGTAVMGKPEDNPRQGDLLDDNFKADLTDDEIQSALNDPLKNPEFYLQKATTRLIYDVFTYQRSKTDPRPRPMTVYTLTRETHDADLSSNQKTVIIHLLSYSDGLGREVQKKMQTDPGLVPQRDEHGDIIVHNGQPTMIDNGTNPRWIGSGWTILNNKGKPVRQYEPFYTDTHQFEFEVMIGVSAVLFYDPLERVIATLHPNHTWEKVVFSPWRQITWDVNDTVMLDPKSDKDIKGYIEKYFQQNTSWKTWLSQTINMNESLEDTLGKNPNQDAAIRSTAHANTPSYTYFDSLGRQFLTRIDNANQQFLFTLTIFDIEGNVKQVIDANNRIVMEYAYNMLGNQLSHSSMEAGKRWVFNDVSGKPLYSWDSRGHQFRFKYDALRRLTSTFLTGTDPIQSDPRIIKAGLINKELLIEQISYGENFIDDVARNIRTRVCQQKDEAGLIKLDSYDFKGNLKQASRQIAQDYKNILDWNNDIKFDPDVYSSQTKFDALNRPIQLTTPDNSIIQPFYNKNSLLNQLKVNLKNEKDSRNQLIWTSFIKNIAYNEKGQRLLIQYGNESQTHYRYDPNTFRLMQLYTRRNGAFPGDCSGDSSFPLSNTSNPCGLQNLYYIYDPIGNITHIQDTSQQPIYFRGQVVEATNDYIYDAIYRLLTATGREHLGQGSNLPSYNDASRIKQAQPSDGNAMGRYQETYQYDLLGNFMQVKHTGLGNNTSGWTRDYQYQQASLLEANKQSNRLTKSVLNPESPQRIAENYAYDAHGNITQMPHLQEIQWDFKDRLIMTRRQAVAEPTGEDEEGNLCKGECTYYVYDAKGERVRKITELATTNTTANATSNANADPAPRLKDERIYMGGFEVYKRYGSKPLTRETLHIMDDKQRIALIETRTEGDEDNIPPRLIRYQYSNHLGSSALELDDKADIISYEEYTPYGCTSYQAVRNQLEAAKRYRFTGKERDEENGLSYHSARYYAPWLGRWMSCDPIGIKDGLNLYCFTRSNPLKFTDPNGTQAFSPKENQCNSSSNTSTPQLEEKQDETIMCEAELDLIVKEEEEKLVSLPNKHPIGVLAPKANLSNSKKASGDLNNVQPKEKKKLQTLPESHGTSAKEEIAGATLPTEHPITLAVLEQEEKELRSIKSLRGESMEEEIKQATHVEQPEDNSIPAEPESQGILNRGGKNLGGGIFTAVAGYKAAEIAVGAAAMGASALAIAGGVVVALIGATQIFASHEISNDQNKELNKAATDVKNLTTPVGLPLCTVGTVIDGEKGCRLGLQASGIYRTTKTVTTVNEKYADFLKFLKKQ